MAQLSFFFFFPFIVERILKKTAAFEEKGVHRTQEKRNGVFIERFFSYHSGNQKSDYVYQISLPQKIFRSIFNEKEREGKKMFTQVLCYAYNSVLSFPNSSIPHGS